MQCLWGTIMFTILHCLRGLRGILTNFLVGQCLRWVMHWLWGTFMPSFHHCLWGILRSVLFRGHAGPLSQYFSPSCMHSQVLKNVGWFVSD